MRRWMWLVVMACSATMLMTSQAWADGPTEADVQTAQAASDLGAQHYYEGNYGRAIVEFQRAHDHFPHPMFLHNIALSNLHLGQLERARAAAREAAAMDEGMPSEAHATNEGVITGATTVLEVRRLANRLAQERGVARDDDDDDVVAPPPVVDEPMLGVLGWVGVGTAVVGVGALVGAAVLDSQIQSGIEELSDAPDQASFDARRDELEGQQTVGKVLLFGGAGLTAVGAGLLVVDLMSGSADRAVGIGPDPREPSIQVRLRF
jgi:hypothetical protein